MGADARGRNNPTYYGDVDFGSQLLQLDDGCLSLNGTLSSGIFFEDLKRIRVGSGFEYRKSGRLVTKYPESLTTSISIEGGHCGATLSNSPSSIFRGDSYSLTFGVEWKDGMQLRPALLSPVFVHCDGSSNGARPLIVCQLTVESKGVSLDDHLIVSVFAPDGKRITRLSAGP
jgi:hypothetical protein